MRKKVRAPVQPARPGARAGKTPMAIAPRLAVVAAAVLLACLAGVAVGEWLGWPFLAAPLQRQLSQRLERRISFAAAGAEASPTTAFRIRFVGGVRLVAPQLEVAAPAWSTAPHLLLAHDVELRLRYTDLWRAAHGQALRIHSLRAATLDAHLERLADGRMSWQLQPMPAGQAAPPVLVPSFGQLQVADGTVRYRDVPTAIDAQARWSLVGAASQAAAPAAAASRSPSTIARPLSVLTLSATGHYRGQPLKIELSSAGAMPGTPGVSRAAPATLTLEATVGHASVVFDGSVEDVLRLGGLDGSFRMTGPSLAAVGDPVGVTLPTTAAFRADGVVHRQGDTWSARIDSASVGSSRLSGDLVYEAGRNVPLLSGRLAGGRLALVDLGPVVGTTPAVAASPMASASASASASAPGPARLANSARSKGKVLPDRPFDLPALRAMDAKVSIDIGEVDLHSQFLEPLRPLRGELHLAGGVLTLKGLDARTGQGQLKGELALDGRGSQALLTTDLRWDGVQLESWLRLPRAEGAPPVVSGRLIGRATLSGRGRSTAEILASLDGKARTELQGGAVSQKAIEWAGMDLAQSLGLMATGDKLLPVRCAVADLVAEGGVFRPHVFVLDTANSTIWIDGSLSLATETMDLRAVVSPSGFSPLALRTPLRVRGSFAHPVVSIEKGSIGRKVARSLLLALVNPLAALIPLVDQGDAEAAARGAAGCKSLMQRVPVKPAAVAAPR